MRRLSIVAVVALVGLAGTAEAKGRRSFGGIWTATPPLTLRTGPSPAGLNGPVPVAATPGAIELLPRRASADPAPESRPAPAVAKPEAPWCASGRITGSGAGFCEIN
ncbi:MULTISPECIES: hypothetical protein [Methylobacterium]|uniref:Uncharacterized protein n=1 Tax=Methylobacterium jeotgali TaxID=381630 RepID=A0ABQ4T370_9HYPH|nr:MULTISPECIES: hypothetical protein [Methylobacterium]PIU08420.1 MAG: hypothetical protein COT56_01475 [Methylobacterium sp. CG09_land_8_20_14_0_10_71_15]PIU11709.1 MAG: hypothetical protein COT28_18715 [Methylobacterium sp. CG08_land_8_20_14_0_20_71_15]GBU18612.1 hypothetical protein AwMethylo_28270 [Methylobacterium sp.]GJE08705.1 hypothetical protein AOPFMNJM_4048 [Methylobacterium jeotgali]